MGGRKKLTLKQMEKMQRRLEEKRKAKREARPTKTSSEKTSTRIIPPDVRDKNVIDEIRRMKVLTPYLIASRFNLRLSVAKDFLEELHQRGLVEYVSGGRNIKIYKPAG